MRRLNDPHYTHPTAVFMYVLLSDTTRFFLLTDRFETLGYSFRDQDDFLQAMVQFERVTTRVAFAGV